MRRLFVNADDFGLTEGVCAGILAAMDAGVVGGTTAMVCAEGGLERLTRLGPRIAGRVGLHLQLTGGRPCLPPEQIPSLVTEEGLFPRKKQAVGDIDPDDVRREWRAQLARFQQSGLAPSHLDSHHHIHGRPGAFPVFVELARELGVPGRAVSDAMRASLAAAGVARADLCLTRFYGENLSAATFVSLADAAFAALGGSGTVEVMVHPGRCDAALAAVSTYSDGRGLELAALTEPGLSQALAARGIRVVTASELAGTKPRQALAPRRQAL